MSKLIGAALLFVGFVVGVNVVKFLTLVCAVDTQKRWRAADVSAYDAQAVNNIRADEMGSGRWFYPTAKNTFANRRTSELLLALESVRLGKKEKARDH